MTSEVEICNLGLSHLRTASINSLTEASIQAQQCKLLYPVLRDQMLQDAPWQFAHRIKPLAVLSTDVFNWAYTYQYPSDCLRINRLILNWEEINQDNGSYVSRRHDRNLPRPNLAPKVEYQVLNVDGNKVITANDPKLRADYRVKVTDPNLFDAQFILGLSHLLAAHLAVPIVGVDKGRKLRSDALSMYQHYINAAEAADANEQHSAQTDSEFITIRQ